jgi:hypothetical protein
MTWTPQVHATVPVGQVLGPASSACGFATACVTPKPIDATTAAPKASRILLRED